MQIDHGGQVADRADHIHTVDGLILFCRIVIEKADGSQVELG